MARTVKEEERAAKRNDILDSAQRFVYSKGYERMTIQDVLTDLKISSGAFYHYFDSKPMLLEALIERGQPEVEQALLAIVDDPMMSALEKLQKYFSTLDRLRIEQRALIADLLHIWFADDNAIVREKSDEVIVQRRAPLLNAIVRQGIHEGVFTTPYPDQAGEVILAITRGMSTRLLKLILAYEREHDMHCIDEIIATSAAMAEAIERVLGSSVQILERPNAQAVKGWLVALNRET